MVLLIQQPREGSLIGGLNSSPGVGVNLITYLCDLTDQIDFVTALIFRIWLISVSRFDNCSSFLLFLLWLIFAFRVKGKREILLNMVQRTYNCQNRKKLLTKYIYNSFFLSECDKNSSKILKFIFPIYFHFHNYIPSFLYIHTQG